MICIICLGENEITDNNPLTDEHIIPEFIGGKLVVKNVCKICNSSLGGGFEGRLSNNFYFKLLRQYFGISGKQDKAPNAFSGVYQHEKLGKIRVDNRNEISIFPETAIKIDDSNISITLRIDKSDLPNARKELSKKLGRHFKKQGKNITDKKLTELSERFFEKANVESKIIESPKVSSSFCWNVNDHTLLHMKVAYELLIFHLGMVYTSDVVGNEIRLCLKEQAIRSDVSFAFTELHELAQFIESDCHWVYINKNFCVVSLFGSVSSLMFTDSNSVHSQLKDSLYIFHIASGNYKVTTLIEHINSLTNKSTGQ